MTLHLEFSSCFVNIVWLMVLVSPANDFSHSHFFKVITELNFQPKQQ